MVELIRFACLRSPECRSRSPVAARYRLCRWPKLDPAAEPLGMPESAVVLATMPSGRRRGKTPHMIDLLRFVSGLAADLVGRHGELIAENALLRQQLIVAHRKVAGRVRWAPWQRF